MSIRTPAADGIKSHPPLQAEHVYLGEIRRIPSVMSTPSNWEPVQGSERYTTLDLVRGFALFGVLLVNLLHFFRVSLFDHFFRFHTHAGWATMPLT